MADVDVPDAVAEPPKRRVQLVWIIPIVAALIGAWIAVTSVLAQGPTVTISFGSAEGLEAGKTKIRYKDVEIGLVNRVSLAPNGAGISAEAQFDKDASDLLVDDTRFWIVKPRISSSSVTGLGTLLSGSYVGVDVGRSKKARRSFQGLEIAPIITTDVPGTAYTLHSEEIGSLGVSSPIYYRRIEAGQVVSFALDADGSGVTLKIFVNAPYDQYVTTNTRFWHASGVDVKVDATGINVDTQSLATIIAGGIAFQAPPDLPPATRAAAEAEFRLAADRATAMRRSDTEAQAFQLYFQESLRGLEPGAPVDFRGIALGQVKTVGIEFDPATQRFLFPVTIELYPNRLRAKVRGGELQAPPTAAAQRNRMDALASQGLRAQLRTGNLLTGQLYIALDFFPQAAKAGFDWDQSPPRLPTTQGTFGELQATLATLSKKLDRVPIDAIATDLDDTLVAARRLIERLDTDVAPAAKDTLDNASRTLRSAQATLATDAPLQSDLRETLRELTRTLGSVRDLVDYLERHPESLVRGKPEDPKR